MSRRPFPFILVTLTDQMRPSDLHPSDFEQMHGAVHDSYVTVPLPALDTDLDLHTPPGTFMDMSEWQRGLTSGLQFSQ